MLPAAVADAIDLSRVRRALVIKLRHHGDVLLTSPVFTVLQRAAPQAEIDALVYRETAPMLAGHPAISELHTIDRDAKRRGLGAQIAAEWRLLRALRARRYDLVVHLTEHPRGAWLKLLLGARRRRRAANASAPACCGASAFTHLYLPPRATLRHTVETNLDALRRIGIWPVHARQVAGPRSRRRGARRASRRCSRSTASSARRFVVVHPGSRWLFKCWPAAATAALIDRLAADGWPVVLTGAPDPAERALVDAVRAATRAPVVDLAGAAVAARARRADRRRRGSSSASTRRRCTWRRRWARRRSRCSARAATPNGGRGACRTASSPRPRIPAAPAATTAAAAATTPTAC